MVPVQTAPWEEVLTNATVVLSRTASAVALDTEEGYLETYDVDAAAFMKRSVAGIKHLAQQGIDPGASYVIMFCGSLLQQFTTPPPFLTCCRGGWWLGSR